MSVLISWVGKNKTYIQYLRLKFQIQEQNMKPPSSCGNSFKTFQRRQGHGYMKQWTTLQKFIQAKNPLQILLLESRYYTKLLKLVLFQKYASYQLLKLNKINYQWLCEAYLSPILRKEPS